MEAFDRGFLCTSGPLQALGCSGVFVSLMPCCRVLEVAPDDVQALSSHGYCMRKMHRMEEAVQDYTRAIQASPPSLRLFNNRAFCLAKLHKYAEAVADYTAVLSMDDKNLHALQNRCAAAHTNALCGTVAVVWRGLSVQVLVGVPWVPW